MLYTYRQLTANVFIPVFLLQNVIYYHIDEWYSISHLSPFAKGVEAQNNRLKKIKKRWCICTTGMSKDILNKKLPIFNILFHDMWKRGITGGNSKDCFAKKKLRLEMGF